MRYRTPIIASAALAAVLFSLPADAGVFGAGLGGAFRGAMLGSLIDGRDGAATGAVIGGLIGAGERASRNKRQRRMMSQRRKSQWAAQEQAKRARAEQQRAAAAPQVAVNQTLVVETQKSLIRLGYDPGELGKAGDALTNAVKRYQSSVGLLETGQMSQELLTHMLRNGG
jgi:outer membrane lipoprotein SlyB